MEETEVRPLRKRTILALFIPLTILTGFLKVVPLAILIPGSLKMNMTCTEIAFLVAAHPLATIPATMMYPLIKGWKSCIYILTAGTIGMLGFSSFTYAPLAGRLGFFYIGLIGRSLTGAADALISIKIGVGWTIILDNDLAKSSMAWEVLANMGKGIGCYIGTLLFNHFGFSVTMGITGVSWFLLSVLFALIYPKKGEESVPLIKDSGNKCKKEETLAEQYQRHFTLDTLVYGWVPMLSIGACIVFVESILVQFYIEEYNKTIDWGGKVIGIGTSIYTISTFVTGPIGVRFRILQYLYLICGLAGVGFLLLFLGPVISVPNVADSTVSAVAYAAILVCSSAIQFASLSYTAQILSKSVATDMAMSTAMNVWNMGYNAGAVLGPIFALNLHRIPFLATYKTVFAIGTPFFIFSSLTVLIKLLHQKFGRKAKYLQSDSWDSFINHDDK